MNNNSFSVLAFTTALGFAGAADAGLIDRGNGLIYDDILKITWLSDANYAATELNNPRRDLIITAVNTASPSWLAWGSSTYTISASDFRTDVSGNYTGVMTWFGAMAWADQLVYGGYTDWRLPATPLPGCGGMNCTGSEMGHMFYDNMEATANHSILSGNNLVNLNLFKNIQPIIYWSGAIDLSGNNTTVWMFGTRDGNQFPGSGPAKLNYLDNPNATPIYAWAVRDGDVAVPPSVPEPGSLALVGLGLAGLGWAQRRRG